MIQDVSCKMLVVFSSKENVILSNLGSYAHTQFIWMIFEHIIYGWWGISMTSGFLKKSTLRVVCLGVHESNLFSLCVSIRKGVCVEIFWEPFKNPEASFQQNRPFPVDSSCVRTWSLNLEVTKSQPKILQLTSRPPTKTTNPQHPPTPGVTATWNRYCRIRTATRRPWLWPLCWRQADLKRRKHWDRVDRCWLDRNLRNLDRWPQIQGSLFFGKQLVTCMNSWGLPSKTPAREMIHSWF